MPTKLKRILILFATLIAIVIALNPDKKQHRPSSGGQRPKPHIIVESQRPKPSISVGAHHPRDFNEAKAILRQLYPRGQDFYCGCAYDLNARQRINTASCGYKGHGIRSQRIEWEHVVPASMFGHRFAEWTQGHPNCQRQGHMEKGRNCARDNSEGFRLMEADLYNLLPVVGELNGARSDYPYGEVAGEPRVFGGCDFEVVRRLVEPRREIRGDIARIYFYMDARYTGFDIVNRDNEGLLTAWDRDDPLDEAERQRLKHIEEVQGNSFFIGRLQRLATASK